MASGKHLTYLLARQKLRTKLRGKIKRFLWRGIKRPRPITPKHVYQVLDVNDKVVGEYGSIKDIAKYAFNGMLSFEEVVKLLRLKIRYRGHRVVKVTPDKPKPRTFYLRVSIRASQKRAIEVIGVNTGSTVTELMRRAVDAFINQEVDKLPEHLKEHL